MIDSLRKSVQYIHPNLQRHLRNVPLSYSQQPKRPPRNSSSRRYTQRASRSRVAKLKGDIQIPTKPWDMFRNPGQFARWGGAYEHHLWPVSKRKYEKGLFVSENIMRLMSRGYFESCTVTSRTASGEEGIVGSSVSEPTAAGEQGPLMQERLQLCRRVCVAQIATCDF